MIPLSKLHDHAAVPIWFLSIFAFFMGSIYLTKRILIGEKPKKDLSGILYLFGILMTLRFLLSVLQRVQSDALMLFLLALFVFALYRKKEYLAGFCLASAAMIKLTPLIFLPYLILRKRARATAACVASLAFYALLPAFYVGWARNLTYLKNWLLVHKTNPADYLLWFKNQSLLSCLLRFFSNANIVYIIFAILAAALFASVFIRAKKLKSRHPGFDYLREISMVLICMIILSPLAWKHTFVHLLIPHLVLLYYAFYINPGDKVTRGLLVGSFLINTILNPEMTGSFAQIIQEYSNVTFGTLLLFAALLRLGAKPCKY